MKNSVYAQKKKYIIRQKRKYKGSRLNFKNMKCDFLRTTTGNPAFCVLKANTDVMYFMRQIG